MGEVNPRDYLTDEGQPRDGAPLGMLLSAQAARQPDALALAMSERTFSFAQVEAAANRLARYMVASGVRADDRVVLTMRNRPEFIFATFALWKIGAVPCPISWRLSAQEFADIIDLIDPRCIVGEADGHPTERAFVDLDWLSVDHLSPAPLPPAIARLGKIMTSGGSTGRPKLIVDPIPSVWGCDKAVSYRPGGITVHYAGPLYHAAPFVGCTVAMLEGSHIVCMERFDPVAWLHEVETRRAEMVCVVPTMMSRIAKLPPAQTAAADLSSIQILLHIAAPCPPDVKRWWIERIGAEKVLEVYGGTERIGATLIDGREWLEHPGSVGRPRPGDEIVILADDGRAVEPGVIGEIHFRRATGAGAYYSYIGSETRIRDGLDSFGDMGWIDEDGYLYIADRRTDMIVVAGINVYPAEVEAVLEDSPGVLCSAVIGLPDVDMGNRIHAIVELAAGTMEPSEGLAFLAPAMERLATFKRPRSVEFTRERIRDDAGKVRRAALRAARLPPL